MKDNCQRDITYLRLSVTDLCNLRCRYCMPAEGVAKKLHSEICSVEELVEMAAAAADCGITKVRLTGGEPLVRRGILDICRGVAALPGIRDVAANPLVRILLHLVLLPIVVAITYEINRFIGRHDNPVTRALSAPGMWMQNFTTFEPDDSMLEVAIYALKLVLPEKKGADAW